ncbi:MAG: hypothetical protein M3539_07085 [Acidobacteriota bacterium]|nr:hypothetical protein [Acidobacteriota bacterium]
MQDSNSKRADADKSREEFEERKSEATSDKTLADVTDMESDTDSIDADQDPGPSPDGALDESNEIKDAGPM